MRIAIVLGALFCASVGSAFASADGDALVKSGLAGRWAQNCARPPGDGNWYDKYEVKGGKVVETLYKDNAKPSRVTTLTNVHIVSSSRVGYSMKDDDGDVLELVVQMDGNRHHTWSSRSTRGPQYIRDGKLVASGTEATWFTKCSS